MSTFFEPEVVARLFQLSLSARYTTFLSTREWQRFDRFFAALPTYESALRVRFQGPALESFFGSEGHEAAGKQAHASANEAELGGAAGWLPLATIEGEAATFLAVQGTDAECPVAMWEPDTEQFTLCAESLDSFLASLGRTKRAAQIPVFKAGDIGEVNEVSNEGEDLLDAAPSSKRTSALEKVVQRLERLTQPGPLMSEKRFAQTEWATVPTQALVVKGRCYEALGRFAEAAEVYEKSLIDGVHTTIAPDELCALWLEKLDAPQKVIALCESLRGSSTRVTANRRFTWGLALFVTGRVDEAAAIINERLALIPTDQPERRAQYVTGAHECIVNHCTSKGLDAAPLVEQIVA